VSKAAANAVRGGDIAKGLLKYARPEKAGFEMQDISKIINLSIEMLGYKHDDWADIEIVRNFSKEIPLTWANISYLQDIYFIVLDNAYDAIKQKKEIQPELKGVISLDVAHDKNRNSIRIVVRDNGIGMKSDILEKVRAAVPYVTTKASSSQKSGYGSGVQVLTRLTKLHDGSIEYESVYGDGTTTVINIPVRGKPAEQSSDKNGRN
jgi:nitrogen fixation/metabolism regulation signal transduction histidine kinase